MTKNDGLKNLAREIADTRGIKYTEALDLAKVALNSEKDTVGVSQAFLRITEINNSSDQYYGLAIKKFYSNEQRDAAYESIEESGDCDPDEDYVWRLELIGESGMIDAEKSLSKEAVESLLGCGVEYAREVHEKGRAATVLNTPRLSRELRSKLKRNLTKGG